MIPIIPKQTDGPVRAIVIGRISTPHQQLSSITASQEAAIHRLRELCGSDLEITRLGEQASGMLADRPTMQEAERLIKTQTIDVVVAEDVSRIYREPQALLGFFYLAANHGTRVICFAENLDTAEGDWFGKLMMMGVINAYAAPDARRRVRRTAVYEFENGGMVLKTKFGYRKLTEAEAASGEFGPIGLRIAKDAKHTDVILELCRRTIEGIRPSELVEDLIARGIPPGPYTQQWSPRVLISILRDPVLCGYRRFQQVISEPIHGTGKSRRQKNPSPMMLHYPELAYITEEMHQQVIATLDSRVSAKQKKGAEHPRSRLPRSRSYFPCQHARCAVCGDIFYPASRGAMRCKNAGHKPGDCWNHVQIDIELTRRLVIEELVKFIQSDSMLNAHIVEIAWKEYQANLKSSRGEANRIQAEIDRLNRERKNLATAIRKSGGKLNILLEELKSVENALAESNGKLEMIASQSTDGFASHADIEARLLDALLTLATSSFRFADIMRQVMPGFRIQPVQEISTKLVRPRAFLTFARVGNGLGSAEADLEYERTLDLFVPPVHIANLRSVTAAKQEFPNYTLKQIAAHLGINHMTVKRSIDLARRLDSLTLESPYVLLTSKPEVASRWRKRRRPASHAIQSSPNS